MYGCARRGKVPRRTRRVGLSPKTLEPFPPTSEALADPNGLLAVGGDLTPLRLVEAYSRGIFPWFNEGQPILWWTPNPRSVLLPDNFHLSRSMRKSLRRSGFRFEVNRNFQGVMRACAALRRDDSGTWISDAMIAAYTRLNDLGIAHSVETYLDDQLVGGLYGVVLGRVFFGESMFSRADNASKSALAALMVCAGRGCFDLVDCQVANDHLESLGAENLGRGDFEIRLSKAIKEETLWPLLEVLARDPSGVARSGEKIAEAEWISSFPATARLVVEEFNR